MSGPVSRGVPLRCLHGQRIGICQLPLPYEHDMLAGEPSASYPGIPPSTPLPLTSLPPRQRRGDSLPVPAHGAGVVALWPELVFPQKQTALKVLKPRDGLW